jgi:energy-coupling factor transport system permease protein
MTTLSPAVHELPNEQSHPSVTDPTARIRRRALLPRWVHPVAWWLWALGLAVAASRTTNPALLGLIIAVAAFVVMSRRSQAPWGRAFSFFLALGATIVVIRIVFQVLLGMPIGTTVLFTLPTIALPEWVAGVQLGGPVTGEEILAGAYEGLRLATIIICVGAANSLAAPSRLLASVPAALYEVGVAIVVAVTFAPQLIMDLRRVRAARRLRGRPTRGLRGLGGSALPVLEGALERSVLLAASMDARGYGRTAQRTVRQRRTAATLLLGSLVAGLIGTYAALDANAPVILGLPMLILAIVCATTGIRMAGRRSPRSRYRPDPWKFPEWLTASCGVIAAVGLITAGMTNVAGLTTQVDPAQWPQLPLLPTAVILLALLPAWLTPIPPDSAELR